MKKQIIYAIIVLLLISHAYGLGIAPSRAEQFFQPSTQKEMFFRIINNENKEMQVYLTAKGSLAPYITFESETLFIKMEEFEKPVKYTINFPGKMQPGQHTAEILVVEAGKEKEGEGNLLMASIGVMHKLTVHVPYPDEYLEGMLFISDARPQEVVTFTITLSNLGISDLKSIKGQILLKGSDSRMVAKIMTNEISIKSSEKSKLTASWVANVEPGSYHAQAIVEYDGGKLLTLEKSFDVGEPLLEIQDLRVGTFKIGSIAKFDIILKSRWNQEMKDVFGITEITDSKGTLVSTYKTGAVDIPPLGISEIYSYWDTSSITPGNFIISIKTNYFGRVREKAYELDVKEDKINVRPLLIGQVITPYNERKGFNNGHLIVLVFIITGSIVLVKIVLDFVIKLKQTEKPKMQKHEPMQELHPELRRYIISKLKQGYSREAIKSTLAEKGWNPVTVEREMLYAEDEMEEKK